MVVPGSLSDWIQAGVVTAMLGATGIVVGRALWTDAGHEGSVLAPEETAPPEPVRAA